LQLLSPFPLNFRAFPSTSSLRQAQDLRQDRTITGDGGGGRRTATPHLPTAGRHTTRNLPTGRQAPNVQVNGKRHTATASLRDKCPSTGSGQASGERLPHLPTAGRLQNAYSAIVVVSISVLSGYPASCLLAGLCFESCELSGRIIWEIRSRCECPGCLVCAGSNRRRGVYVNDKRRMASDQLTVSNQLSVYGHGVYGAAIACGYGDVGFGSCRYLITDH